MLTASAARARGSGRTCGFVERSSGHQKDYELVGIMPTAQYPEGYVPRKADRGAGHADHGVRGQPLVRPEKVGNAEHLCRGMCRRAGANWLRSQLPSTRSQLGPTGRAVLVGQADQVH